MAFGEDGSSSGSNTGGGWRGSWRKQRWRNVDSWKTEDNTGSGWQGAGCKSDSRFSQWRTGGKYSKYTEESENARDEHKKDGGKVRWISSRLASTVEPWGGNRSTGQFSGLGGRTGAEQAAAPAVDFGEKELPSIPRFSPTFTVFADFLGRLHPRQTRLQRPPNALGAEESSSPRRALHF